MPAGFLQRERIIAPPGWSRWLIPPAALSIHLAIGQAYAWTAFKTALTGTMLKGNPNAGVLTALPFQLAIVMLGISAALFGTRVDAKGPRWAMVVASACFVAGFLISALGVSIGAYWLVVLGYGFVGGIGLGIGYISPVSTLIKWFPDRPGLSTGIAIMGFGGGALIGAPLAVALIKHFSTPTFNGVAPTMLTMGVIYLAFMMIGAFIVRVPADGWAPAGYVPTTSNGQKMITTRDVLVAQAVTTPQFWLLWVVLFANVTAGIGVLGQASLMIQEMFPGKFPHADPAQIKASAAVAAGFVGLLSIFNMGGRIFWASMSDFLGRKTTYAIFFALGIALYASIPSLGKAGNLPLFIACYAVILSMYGGGFATIPAYLKDLFGTLNVGAIHGRLLTAWSAAGVAGPVLVNYIREYQIGHGVAKADAYSVTMYIMAGLLVVGFVCNLLVTQLGEKHYVAVGTGALKEARS